MTQPPEYRISLDPAELQLDVIHSFLYGCYWSPGIPRETVATAIQHSLTVAAYAADGAQVGFARLVTDHATFGYLADVFVLEPHRGRGLAPRMVRALLGLPEVLGLRRILLVTRDAHGVYAQCGFEQLQDPAPYMQIVRRDLYR